MIDHRRKSSQPELDDRTVQLMAEIFSQLSDPSRIRIISALRERELNVGSLAGIVGISESAVSHHLRGLRQMRLVGARKDGRQVFYHLDDEHVAEVFQRILEHVLHS